MTHSKKIDRILKKYFFRYEDEPDLTQEYFLSHFNLCFVFENTRYEYLWDDFWDKVNTKGYIFLSTYFNHQSNKGENALLRLLLVEEFKEYLDNGCQFK